MAVEILAPAGNKESLQAAFAAGCDAVYFGLPSFGARAYANNFTLKETKEIIAQAHVLGIRIYITMNTILYEDEIEEAYTCAKKLYEYGVDALIIQDLGFIHLLHHRLPDLELHASTQLSVSTPNQIKQLKKLGVSRVVLARECTLEQMKACVQTGMEIEVFVHGALCISYSGQCNFSEIRYHRSGNRGMCAQPCRMQYVLEKDGKVVDTKEKFLLSPKDLSLMDHIKELEAMGVASLKIEGRMKSPEYVYTTVSKAKKVLENEPLTETDWKELMVSFNRGYTLGHPYEEKGRQLMNMKTSNHQGIPIGKVIGVHKNRIQIRLNDVLTQNDGIRFDHSKHSDGCYVNFMYDNTNQLVHQAYANQIVEVEGPNGIRVGSIVRKTVDSVLQDTVANQIKTQHPSVSIQGKVWCKGIGYPLVLEVTDGKYICQVQTEQLAMEAQKRPTDWKVLEKQLTKTKDSWADFSKLEYDLAPDIYFTISEMNALRRKALASLEEKRKSIVCQKEIPYSFLPHVENRKSIFVEISKPEQKINIEGIHYVSEFIPGTLKKATLTEDQGDVLTHLGKGDVIMNMNVVNSYAVAALLELGYKVIGVSDEMDFEKLNMLMNGFYSRYHQVAPVMKTIYQKRRLMIINHCPVNTIVKDGSRQGCHECRSHAYTLRGKDGQRVLCYGDHQCHMRLFDTNPTDLIDDFELYKRIGISTFYMCFIDENQEETKLKLETLSQMC